MNPAKSIHSVYHDLSLPSPGFRGRRKSLQCRVKKVLRTNGNFPRRTAIREFHVASNIPYLYDFITSLFRQQAEVIQNHENAHIHSVGQRRNHIHAVYKRLKFGGGQAYEL
jgi:hypothetical protein